MKKVIFAAMMAVLSMGVLFFSSCKKDALQNSEATNVPSYLSTRFVKTSLLESEHLIAVESFCEKAIELRGLNIDFSSSTYIKDLETNSETINLKINKNKNEESSFDDRKLVLIIQNNEVKGIVKVKTTLLENGTNIQYYNEKNNLVCTTFFDYKTLTTKTTLGNDNLLKSGPGAGQRAANCIDHVYTKMGWWSVAAFAVSALDPGMGVAIAAGCSLGALLGG